MGKQIRVVGAVMVRGNRVLCAQRGPLGSLPGKWEFPGGKIEDDESPEAALAREIEEELGIRITVRAHLDTTTHTYPFASVTLDTYFAEIRDGEPFPSEHSELRWCAAGELKDLDWAPADVPAVRKLVAMSRAGESQWCRK